MAYEIKENQINIFKNIKKTEEKHPDYKGQLKINGVMYDIGLWISESKAGKKYMNGRVSEHRVKSDIIPGNSPEEQKRIDETFNSDLPF